eukprot:jgi/Chlat1/7880/Chrsp66S09178
MAAAAVVLPAKLSACPARRAARSSLPARRPAVASMRRSLAVSAKLEGSDGSVAGPSAAFSLAMSALLAAGPAMAQANEVAQIAEGDNRGSLLLLIPALAIGWVGFNILGPALRQLDGMSKKGLAIGAAGLTAAAMGVAGSAEAAEAAAAASDSRAGALLLIPALALAWVTFNIFGPATRQLDTMSKKGLVIGAAGLSAAALLGATESAQAAQEFAQVAATASSDNRGTLLLLIPALAIGWVGFNILGPALRQLNNMSDKPGNKRK